MDTETLEKKNNNFPKKFTKRKFFLVSMITFILLMLALTSQFSYMTLKNENIYKGVFINNIEVSRYSTAELMTLLKSEYSDKVSSSFVLLSSPTYSEKISFSELDVKYDANDAVKQAYQIGRSGNFIRRLYDILTTAQKKHYINMKYSYDSNKLASRVNVFHSNTLINVKNPDLFIQGDRVILKTGHHGESIDASQVLKLVDDRIRFGVSGELPITINKTAPEKINIDDFYYQIMQNVQDASVTIIDNKASFTPEIIGRQIDKEQLISIANEMEKTENTEKVLPVTFVQPKVTLKEIMAKLFKDELYTFSSVFKLRNENEINRSVNIRLEVAKINGTILAPGEVFSYNNTVGMKTPEQGYKEAYTYVAGKQVAGLGGGICQVSSTLYNAVLYADLEVLQRRNHMFEVFYVPLGQDATVYYGSTDFQFKNNTNWPIQINCWVTNKNQVFFSLKGTNETPGKTVKIKSVQIGDIIPFTTRYIDDPSVKKEVIDQLGHDGGKYETYKSIYQDGKLISTKKISTSVYKPLEQVVKRPPQKLVSPTPVPVDTKPSDNSNVLP